MPIDNVLDRTPRVQYVAATSQTAFDYPFPIFADADLVVDVDGVTKALGTHYTVAGAGDDNGGTMTFLVAPGNGKIVTIYRDIAIERTSDFQTNGPLRSSTFNDELDRLTMILQQLEAQLGRTLRLPITGQATSAQAELSPIANWLNKYITINASGVPEPAAIVAGTISQSIIAALLYPQTTAEQAAGVTPDDLSKNSAPLIDIERYHVGTIGNATDDDNAVDAAIAVIKQSGGLAVIPSSFNSGMAKPALGLANGQSGALLDLRMERTIAGDETFGAIDWYVEGRDAGGNYASEIRILGKQNPAWTAYSLSDGTANGYPRPNFASSFLHAAKGASGQGVYQMIADPLMGKYYSWGLVSFQGGSGTFVLYSNSDANNKPRITLAPANLAAATGSVSNATNATPIVITTSAPHLLAGVNQPVTMASVGGNTAANGDWQVTVLSANTFSLNGSVGNGAYTSGGTFVSQKNHSRATLNVPKTQGGTEAIFCEGVLASGVAQGSAPITTESDTGSGTLHARPYIVNINGVQQSSGTVGAGGGKIVEGNVPLVAGTATVTLANDAVFTSTATYKVVTQNITNSSAQPKVTRVSGSQFTVSIAGGASTDSIDWIAVGF